MNVSYDVTASLRANMKHHEPIVLVFDARGNGGGYHLTYDYRRSSRPNHGLHGDSGGT